MARKSRAVVGIISGIRTLLHGAGTRLHGIGRLANMTDGTIPLTAYVGGMHLSNRCR